MKLYHVTLRKNMESITREGLCPHYSTGKMFAVWLVPASLLSWALLHVEMRHKTTQDKLVVYSVNVKAEKLSLSGIGTYFTTSVVLPELLRVAID